MGGCGMEMSACDNEGHKISIASQTLGSGWCNVASQAFNAREEKVTAWLNLR